MVFTRYCNAWALSEEIIAHWVSYTNDNHWCSKKSIFLIASLADGSCTGSHFLTAGCLCFFALSNQIIQYGLQIHHTAYTYTPLKRSLGFFSAMLELLHTGDLTLHNLKQLNRKGNRFCSGKGCHFSFEIMEKLPLSLHPPCHVKEIKGWHSGSPFRWKTQASICVLKYFFSKSRTSASFLQSYLVYSAGKR